MKRPVPQPVREEPREAGLRLAISGFFDPDWYQARYPDIIVAGLDPLHHFIHHGLAERRDPNRFFDNTWYNEHYPDVGVIGLHPLLHYLRIGAAALRNPHPNFDATWYAGQHPEAAGNPLLYHIKTGVALGYPTEKPLDIQDYLASTLPPMKSPRRVVVDVVIPVYRGLEETRRCLASVLADTAKPLGRIIVVDDRSPEPELSAWLRDLADRRLIHLVRNPRNVGFVTSVNRGMAAAGNHDVVLLNSDTEVPSGWLTRLAAQAYAHPRIASVSPFSNNATICGYPDDFGGDLAFGRSVADIDDVCRTTNAGRWVDVPTTVGFCMYIRRKALQEVGEFDAKRFTVGYGEENDFCLRASDKGWQHRLACDTFVYHKGSVSFGDRAQKLSERAMQLILERYPAYREDIARYVGAGAVIPYRFAITAALIRQSALPVILMVAHDLGGGVHRHISSLVQHYSNRAHILLLVATDRGAALSVPSMPKHPTLALPAERQGDLVLMLRSMRVSRVHIHNLIGMDMDIRALIRTLEVPFDITVHDYYTICPQINLLPWRHSLYCNEPDIGGCNACIAHRGSHGARDIVTWRADQAWQLKDAARVLCPSLDVVTRLQRYGLAANAVLAPHEPVVEAPWNVRVPASPDGKLRIAVLGTLVDHKGGRSVASVAEHLDAATTELYLIGQIDGPFSQLALNRMTITGRYDDADLAGLIASIAPHVIWFPPVWPETYSYTLTAAIDAGIPIAATRIGSHAERLAGRPLTVLADIDTSPAAWIEVFEGLRRACQKHKPAKIQAKRPAAEDFYGQTYLRPSPRPRAVRSKPRIIIVPERFDIGFPTPCGYIRLIQPLFHPAVVDDFDVRIATAETVFDYEAEIIVTQRFALSDINTANRLAAHTKRIGASLVYDLDDDLLNIPRTHPDARVLRPSSRVARRLVEIADAVWVSTNAFAERLSAIRPDAVVLENRLDERIWQAPAGPSLDKPVRILCMGTTTHDHDLALILPALCRLKEEYDDRIKIDIIGMSSGSELPAGLNRIGPPPSAMRSYPGFVHWLTTAEPGWHIGLAPLLATPFNLCKSPIKAMDYAAMGMVVLASDSPVYRGSVADGPAGLLVPNTAAAWYAALNRLLRDPEQRHAIAARARGAFLTSASLGGNPNERKDALLHLLAVRKRHAAA
jgi:GT2 family glycosyltransferase/glycosyltransferase involved in cell wall biosynthesis